MQKRECVTMEEKTFVEAFTAKYLTEEEEDEEEDDDMTESGIVILCPKSKPSQASSYRRVILDRQSITSAGDCGQISEDLKNVRELDLSANHLRSWKEVEAIIRLMPRLEFLNLASTSLADSDRTDANGDDVELKQSVKVLVLNSTMISWTTVNVILSALPCVEEVHLSLNNFSNVPDPSHKILCTHHTSIQRLYFNDNKVTRWSEVAKIGQIFPNLKSLLLVNNFLTGLTDDIGLNFPHLEQLSIQDTKLSQWDEIDNLNTFTSLTEIQLQRIPLLEGLKAKESRQLVIARLPRITKLNNSPIFEAEREDAERHLIRKYMDEPDKPKRYEELFAMHKNVHRLAEVNLKPTESVVLTIKYEDQSTELEISVNQTCLQLKKYLASHFKVHSKSVRLCYLDMGINLGYDELKVPSASLHRFNMRDGDVILLEKK
ncbi:Tubulin-specific chaperone cofactor E-like protein [Holothuria leucospilota]|uniref:Tubulin-specific chaperone cofactor E-like protein n=1 Tax=Holothuria leucospilota TaxID=206669 RepID=A0A9Q1BWW6_HOLLE|nr:Tubulin-specific chaperone cofactor E-like protein [Holothuria leucospilota]